MAFPFGRPARDTLRRGLVYWQAEVSCKSCCSVCPAGLCLWVLLQTQISFTLLQPEYPFKPPAIMMLTPSGRFATGTRLCLSMSDFHPVRLVTHDFLATIMHSIHQQYVCPFLVSDCMQLDIGLNPEKAFLFQEGRLGVNWSAFCWVVQESWNPMWTVSSILTGLLSFMIEDQITTGSLKTTVSTFLLSAHAALYHSTICAALLLVQLLASAVFKSTSASCKYNQNYLACSELPHFPNYTAF